MVAEPIVPIRGLVETNQPIICIDCRGKYRERCSRSTTYPCRKNNSVSIKAQDIMKFFVICGATGVGKTTIIKKLTRNRSKVKIKYVTPYMNRFLRDGEDEKISVEKDRFEKMEKEKKFVIVNEIYGNKYGTPKGLIDEILQKREIPILDFPLIYINKLKKWELMVYYLLPPSFDEIKRRLIDRGHEERIREATREVEWFLKKGFKKYSNVIDKIILNDDIERVVAEIKKDMKKYR